MRADSVAFYTMTVILTGPPNIFTGPSGEN